MTTLFFPHLSKARVHGLALLAALLCAGSARTAAAQSADTIEALTPGRRSISLSVPQGGGPVFGLWKVRNPSLNRGLLVTLGGDVLRENREDDVGDATVLGISLGPVARRYFNRSATIAPFVHSSAMIGGDYAKHGDSFIRETWSLSAALGLGIGAEWFPAKRASIAGHTGITASAVYGRREINDEDSSLWSLGLRTFTSGITLQLYF